MRTLKEKLMIRLQELKMIPATVNTSNMIMGICVSGCAASCSGCRGCGGGCASYSPCPRR